MIAALHLSLLGARATLFIAEGEKIIQRAVGSSTGAGPSCWLGLGRRFARCIQAVACCAVFDVPEHLAEWVTGS
jgi:hypothetical protein